jgi:hypothetical protein
VGSLQSSEEISSPATPSSTPPSKSTTCSRRRRSSSSSNKTGNEGGKDSGRRSSRHPDGPSRHPKREQKQKHKDPKHNSKRSSSVQRFVADDVTTLSDFDFDDDFLQNSFENLHSTATTTTAALTIITPPPPSSSSSSFLDWNDTDDFKTQFHGFCCPHFAATSVHNCRARIKHSHYSQECRCSYMMPPPPTPRALAGSTYGAPVVGTAAGQFRLNWEEFFLRHSNRGAFAASAAAAFFRRPSRWHSERRSTPSSRLVPCAAESGRTMAVRRMDRHPWMWRWKPLPRYKIPGCITESLSGTARVPIVPFDAAHAAVVERGREQSPHPQS